MKGKTYFLVKEYFITACVVQHTMFYYGCSVVYSTKIACNLDLGLPNHCL